MYEAANAEKIVAALRETEAESEATRRLSDRAVELLHQSGVTRDRKSTRLNSSH